MARNELNSYIALRLELKEGREVPPPAHIDEVIYHAYGDVGFVVSKGKREMVEIFVAVDQSAWSNKDSDTLMELVELKLIQGVKFGLEVFTSDAAERASNALANHKVKRMWDWKFHDIGNTVGRACANIAFQRPDIVTVHAGFSSPGMIKAAVEALEPVGGIVAGVTVLTDNTNEDLAEMLDIDIKRSRLVPSLANWATMHGAKAIVSSAKELPMLMEHKSTLVREAFKIIPGIRLGIAGNRDQKNVTLPGEAAQMGADALVIGSEIWGQENPVEAAMKIKEHLDSYK